MKKILGSSQEGGFCRLKVGVPDGMESGPEIKTIDFDGREL
jgi:hypothetical protein